MIDLNTKTVLVTGANSMTGKALVPLLERLGANVIQVKNRHSRPLDYKQDSIRWADLCSYDDCCSLFEDAPIDYVIHLAGYNGNVLLNKEAPATIFSLTTKMALNVFGNCAHYKIKKVVTPLTSCGYLPIDDPVTEDMYLQGQPHASVEAHGHARRFMYIMGQQYNKQCGNRFVFPIFNNLYGQSDRFGDDRKLKVCGALIEKFCIAKRDNISEVVIWGTGNPKRELLHVEDAAEALVKCLIEYEDYSEPINIGCGYDCSIKEMAETIKEMVGYTGNLVFDTSKPEGAGRKLLNVDKMKKVFPNWSPTHDLGGGIRKTVDWYQKNYCGTQLVKV